MSSALPAPATRPPLMFDAVLTPHRSLTRAGFAVLIAVFVVLSLAVGLFFMSMGGWPVIGFYGLEVAALTVAFRLSYRSGRLRETLQLSAERLTVRRFAPSGTMREWRFQPFWLRVDIDDPPANDSRLTLTSHGRSLTVGGFLTAPERCALAQALRAALARLHGGPDAAPAA